MPKNLKPQGSKLPNFSSIFTNTSRSRYKTLREQHLAAGNFVDRLFSAMDDASDVPEALSNTAAGGVLDSSPDYDRIQAQGERLFERARGIRVDSWTRPENQTFRTPLNRIANPQLPQFARQASGRVAGSEPNPAYSTGELFKQLGGVRGLNYDDKTGRMTFQQVLGAGKNQRIETYDINRDSRSGLITIGHQDSPSRGFAVTGRININTNQRTEAVDVLRERLNVASKDPANSVVKGFQTADSSANLHLGHLTAQSKAKWASAYLLTQNPDKAGNQPKLYSSNVHEWMKKTGNEDFAYRGEGQHVWSASQVASANFASFRDASGNVRWMGGKNVKREQNQGIHETFEHQIAPGVSTPLTQWGARYSGQTSVSEGVKMRSAFALHSNALVPEGQAFINKDSGYIGTTSTQRVKLNEQQMALMREGKHDEALGYQTGDIFNYRRRGTPTTVLDTDRVREGIHSNIPGLAKSDAGSYTFARIGGVEFNEEGGYADVSLTKNIPTWEGVAKFGAKDSLAPVSGDSPMLNIGGQRVSMLRNIPDANDLANLGMHSLLSTYGTDELQSRFVQHAMSSRNMSEGDATTLFGSGVIGEGNSQIFDEMARQHVKDSFVLDTIKDQRVNADQMRQYATQDDSGAWIPNKTTSGSGQDYSVYSNIRPQQDGSFMVDYTDEFLSLSKTERFKPEYDKGRHLVNEEMLNNMVLSNPGLYESVRAMQSAGFAPNSARDLTQAVYANVKQETRDKLESQGRIVDFSQLGYSQALGGISRDADEAERVTGVMKALAAGEHGDKAIRVGDTILPSAKAALSNLTQDQDGELVKTFGKQWYDALTSAENVEALEGAGGNTGQARHARDVAAHAALTSAAQLADTESIQKRAKGIELEMVGGHAMARSGLAANEVVMSKQALFEQMGIHQLPEEHRAAAKQMALEAVKNQQVGLSHNMFPHSVPSKAYPVAQISLLNDVRKRQGMKDLGDPGNNYWISPELSMMMAKDNDGDQNYGYTTGKIGLKDGQLQLIGGKAPVNTAEYVKEHARKSVLEYQNLADGAGANRTDMLAEMDASRQDSGKTIRDAGQYAKDFQGVVAGKAAMGPTYNMGIREHLPFAREQAAEYLSDAGGDLEERRKRHGQTRMVDESLSYLAEKSYQQATKLSENDDPATRQMLQAVKSLKYDTSRGGGHTAGFVEDGKFEKAGDGSIVGLSDWITKTVAGYNMDNSEYAATPEAYAANVAPDLARALVPMKHVGNEDMEAKVRERLIEAKRSGKDFDVQGYLSDIGLDNVKDAVIAPYKTNESGDAIPLLNYHMGAAIANMDKAAANGKNTEAAAKHRGNLGPKLQGYADKVSGIREFTDKINKSTNSAEAYGAAANLPGTAFQHSKTAVEEMLGGGKFTDLPEAIANLNPVGAFAPGDMDAPIPTGGDGSNSIDVPGSMPYYGNDVDLPEVSQSQSAAQPPASTQPRRTGMLKHLRDNDILPFDPPNNSYSPTPAAAGAGGAGNVPPHNPAAAGALPTPPQPPVGGGNAGAGTGGGNVVNNITNMQARLGNTTFADADKLAAFNEHFTEFVDLLDKAKDTTQKLNPVEQKRLETLSKAYDDAVSIQGKYEQRQRASQTNGANMSPADREIQDVLGNQLDVRLKRRDVRESARDFQRQQALDEFSGKLYPDDADAPGAFELLTAGGKKGKAARDQAFKDGAFNNFLSDSLPEGVNRGAAAATGAVGRVAGNLLNPGTLWKLRTLNSMFVQPGMNAAKDYEAFEAQSALVQASTGMMSREEMMSGEYGRMTRRENRREAAHRAYGEQAYSLYAPVMDAFATKEMTQSIAGTAHLMGGNAVTAGIVGQQVGKAVFGEAKGAKMGMLAGMATIPLQLGAYALGNRNNYEAIGKTGQWHDLITNPAGVLGKSGAVLDMFGNALAGSGKEGQKNYVKAGSSALLNQAGNYLASGEYSMENVKQISGDVGGFLTYNRRTSVGEQFTNAEIRGAGYSSWFKNMTEKEGYSTETSQNVYGTWSKYNRDLLAMGAVAPDSGISGALGEFIDTNVDIDGYMSSMFAAQGVGAVDAEGRGQAFRDQLAKLVEMRQSGENMHQYTDEQKWGNTLLSGANASRRVAGLDNLKPEEALKYKDSPEQALAFANLKDYEAQGTIYNPYSIQYSGMVGYRQDAIDRGDTLTEAKLAGATDYTAVGMASYHRSRGTSMESGIANMGMLSAGISLDSRFSQLGEAFGGDMANLASRAGQGTQGALFKDWSTVSKYLDSGSALHNMGIDGQQMLGADLGATGKMGTSRNLSAAADTVINDMLSGTFDPYETELKIQTSDIRNEAGRGARLAGRLNEGESYNLTHDQMLAMTNNDAVGTAWSTAVGARNQAAMAQDGFETSAYNQFNKIEDLAFSDPTTAMRLSGQMQQGQALYQQYQMYGGGKGAMDAAVQMGMLDQPDFQRVNALAQGDRLALSQNYGSMAQVDGMGPDNIRLRTMNAQTGMGIFYENVDAAGVQQLRANDTYGLTTGLSDELLAKGQRGIQGEQRLVQRGFEQFQYERQMDTMALDVAMQRGGGTVGANSYMTGSDGLAGAEKLFEKLGKSFMKGIEGSSAYGMNFSQLEDASRKLRREQQDFSMAQEEKQMGAGGLRQRSMDLQISQFYEKFGLNERQFAWNTANTQFDMTKSRGRELTQQSWGREDLSYSRSQNELSFAWSMEDSDRNLRYSRGRERRDLMRQRGREVIQHSMQMARSDVEGGRLETQAQWSAQDFKIQQERFEQSIKFTKEEMEMQKRHFEESMALQRESFGMEREAHEMKKQWVQEEREIEDQQILLQRQNSELQMELQKEMAERSRAVQVEMNQFNDALQRMGDEQAAVNAQIDLLAKTGKLAEAAMNGMNGAAAAAAGNTLQAAVGIAAMAGASAVIAGTGPAAAQGLQLLSAEIQRFIGSFSRPTSSGSNTNSPRPSGGSNGSGSNSGGSSSNSSASQVANSTRGQYGYADGGLVDKPMRGFDAGGFTGYGGKNEVAGVVHGGEYVVPQDGALVIRNDDMAADIRKMVKLLEKLVSYGPMRVNARITTNQRSVRVGDFNPTDDIYSNL